MKRSEINRIMADADAFARANSFYFPPFAYWTRKEWEQKGEEAKEIADCGLGWDITDWGRGSFGTEGLFLFTLRNGAPENLQTLRGKTYAEKLLVVNRAQHTPLHFHWTKMEDIINRGGGTLALRLYNSTPDEGLDSTPVSVSLDGVRTTVQAGDVVRLGPGQSISLPQRLYHEFWAEGGRVLAGEVSMCNDDDVDNRFYDAIGRFPEIEEDEEPLYLLTKDYPRYYRFARGR